MPLPPETIREPLRALAGAYGDPLRAARAAAAMGQPVFAKLGVGVPDEVILACGGFPVALVPQLDVPTPIADTYMDPEEQHDLRSLLDQVASPEARLFALAILTVPYGQLSSTIEDLRRHGLLPDAAPASYFELLVASSEANRRFGSRRVRDLAARIGAVTGRPATPAALSKAIAITNRRRSALRALAASRRGAAAIGGADAFRAIGAAGFLDPADYAGLLETLVAGLAPNDRLARRPRVLLAPSSPITHDHAHEALDAAGVLVVGEDDPLGARAAEQPIVEGDDPVQAIVDHYIAHATGARVYPADLRLGWLRAEAVKPDIDAVIFYAQEARFGWDYPAMRDYLDAHGTPSLFVRADARIPAERDRMQAEVAAFAASLKPRNGGDAR